MIPNNTKRGKVTGNMGATRSKKLTVNTNEMQHIMGLLTTQYSDEELACIREYSTNALDAQREAGYTGPVRVSTPTNLAPTLRIKDQGTGISADDLLNMYTEYGTSSKRENADANGFMGIGSKAALSYGDQFSIVTVKDGWKTVASISRAEDDSANMDITSETKTDEPNGTEIIIPAKQYHHFDQKAQALFKFWAPGTVVINGEEPNRDDLEKMTDRIYFHDGEDDIIVMGGVPYPLDRGYNITSNGRKTATFVTMNGDDEVVIHPSRERLIYNGITTNAIQGIKEEFESKIREFIDSEIQACDNFVQAYRLINKYKNEYGKKFTDGITYNGVEIKDTTFKKDQTLADGTVHSMGYDYTQWLPRRDRNSVYSYSNLSMHILDNAKMIITGYTSGSGVASNHKARVKIFMQGHSLNVNDYWGTVIFIRAEELPEPDMTSGFVSYKWSDIMTETKAAMAARSGGGGVRGAKSYGGKYDVYDPDTNRWTVEALETDAEILYFSEKDTPWDYNLIQRILKENPDVVFVKASANRHAKLAREYPNSKEFNSYTWTEEFAKADFDALSADDLEYLRARTYLADHHIYDYTARQYVDWNPGVENVPSEYASLINDPEYSAAVALYNRGCPVLNWSSYDERYRANEKAAEDERTSHPEYSKRYPLMNWHQYPSDTLEYVNAMYAMNNKEN